MSVIPALATVPLLCDPGHGSWTSPCSCFPVCERSHENSTEPPSLLAIPKSRKALEKQFDFL